MSLSAFWESGAYNFQILDQIHSNNITHDISQVSAFLLW